MSTCAECGFRWDASPGDVIAAIAPLGRRFAAPVSRFLPGEDGDTIIRTRPERSVWSALEYVAHTRDALGFYEERIRRVLGEDRPQLHAFGFEAACEERQYNAEDAQVTVAELAQNVDRLVALLERIDTAGWSRVGIGSDGDERTVLVLARRAAHEGAHHLLDVGRVLRRVRMR